jgi:hypothetical protein
MNTSRRGAQGIVLGAEPRANLLPPEVRQSDRARSVRRIFVMLVILTVVVVSGGYAASAFRAAQAQGGLDVANARTLTLHQEMAKYAEATSLSKLVKTVTSAQEVAGSKEVLWDTYYDAIVSLLPAGVTLVSGTMVGQFPWDAAMRVNGPLREPRVATISFVLSSANIIDETTVVRRLSELGGFGDASADTLTLIVDEDYSLAVTLNLSSEALSGRFAAATAEVSE